MRWGKHVARERERCVLKLLVIECAHIIHLCCSAEEKTASGPSTKRSKKGASLQTARSIDFFTILNPAHPNLAQTRAPSTPQTPNMLRDPTNKPSNGLGGTEAIHKRALLRTTPRVSTLSVCIDRDRLKMHAAPSTHPLTNSRLVRRVSISAPRRSTAASVGTLIDA
jgi:hypothetical protein